MAGEENFEGSDPRLFSSSIAAPGLQGYVWAAGNSGTEKEEAD